MDIVPRLKSQIDLLAELRVSVRDPGGDNQRWDDNEFYHCINRSIQEWSTRVQVPRVYEISFVSGTYEYTLPSYIQTSVIDVQAKATIWGVNNDTSEDWRLVYEPIPAYRVEPDEDGGQTLILESNLGTTDGRIIWWGYNGMIPTTVPLLNAEISSSATSLVLKSIPNVVGRVGYVKVDNEYMAYTAVSDDGSTMTLSGLDRNMNGSTAALHSADAEVEFCIAVPVESLWAQLERQVAFYLHTMFLTDGSPKSSEQHERMITLWREERDNFWKGWIPMRSARITLSRQSMKTGMAW